MTALAVNGLLKKFGGLCAVRDLDFEVQAGSIYGIIGPNGAGKTSLFNLVTGFLHADHGSVRLHGREVLGMKPHHLAQQGLARTFQLVKPFVGLTALETVMLPACTHKGSDGGPAARRQEALRLLERMNLASKHETTSEALNQGELRLLDIARALATKPDVLLLDEPFSGLGPQAIQVLAELLKSRRTSGATTVIIEHRLRELMPLVDRVLVLNFGARLAEGTPGEVVTNPKVIEAYLGTKAVAV